MFTNQTRSLALAGVCLSVAVSLAGATCTDWRWANPQPQGNRLSGVAHGNSRFVAVGGGGALLVSTDGANWSLGLSGTKQDLSDVVWSGAKFVAVGASGTVLTSADGLAWAVHSAGVSQTRGRSPPVRMAPSGRLRARGRAKTSWELAGTARIWSPWAIPARFFTA